MKLTLSLWVLAVALAPQEGAVARPQEAAVRSADAFTCRIHPPPTELFEVARVIDGDTIHIQRNGELQKLRLLSVDTEEKILGRPPTSPTKPETVFGEETMHWTHGFFDALALDGKPARIGLAFPEGAERRDVFGRVLCNVVLPDGTDFNLLLVRLGKSPYFNKYGDSQICHDALRSAQNLAREEQLGIWNPETNQPKTPGAPAAQRPYARLLPWWQARSEAVANFRRKQAADAERVIASDDPAALARALELCAKDRRAVVEVFGSVDRFFDEPDGSVNVLLRPENTRNLREAVRAAVSADARPAIEKAIGLASRRDDFRQNYLFVVGRIEAGPHGYVIRADDPDQWELAGPEPAMGR